MKFKKLFLNESSIDDFDRETAIKNIDRTSVGTRDMISKKSVYEDLSFESDIMDDMNDHLDAPEGPKEGSDTGVADLLITAINDEWEAIRKYNSLIATLRFESTSNSIYESFVDVISEISNEENKHVGQLQELLKQISPNVESISDGEVEGASQLKFANGKLQVQSWNTPVSNSSNATNSIDDICVISDVDDEM